MGQLFDAVIVNSFITLLLWLYSILGNVFLAIVAFTVIIRMAIMPLTLKQYRSLKAMQEVQPKLKALQDKYKDDREVLVQKQMELYREHKINPLAGCWPLLVQLPILIGLFRAIIATLAATPGQLLTLEDRIYDNLLLIPLPDLSAYVPLENQFLWLNLAVPDPYLILPIIVMVVTWLQQKLMAPPAPKKKTPSTTEDGRQDPSEQAAAMTRQMTTIMPIMFGFITMTYSSGLAIYFIVSALIGIAQQAALGRADFRRLIGRVPLSDDEKEELEKYGRRRIEGISDTRETRAKYRPEDYPRADEKRSDRLRAARAKAARVKLN